MNTRRYDSLLLCGLIFSPVSFSIAADEPSVTQEARTFDEPRQVEAKAKVGADTETKPKEAPNAAEKPEAIDAGAIEVLIKPRAEADKPANVGAGVNSERQPDVSQQANPTRMYKDCDCETPSKPEPPSPWDREKATPDPTRGLPIPAFSSTPTIIRIVRRGELPPEDDPEETDLSRTPLLETIVPDTSTYDFAGPARFPVPKFGLCGEEFEADGALIYEGMRFVTAPNGNYEVRFVISTPAMPVTLRMQLVLDAAGNQRTVTLPPIVIPPHVNNSGAYESASWQVRHLGYSPVLVRPALIWGNPDIVDFAPKLAKRAIPALMVRRKGVARFGSVPTSLDGVGY